MNKHQISDRVITLTMRLNKMVELHCNGNVFDVFFNRGFGQVVIIKKGTTKFYGKGVCEVVNFINNTVIDEVIEIID